MADHSDKGFEYLHIPATELRPGDVIALGFREANTHHVERVGRETFGKGEYLRDFVTYEGSTGRGERVDAHILPDAMLDVRRNLNI